MGVAVGIDLGTTNCVVARIDPYGRPLVVGNALGAPITPSVICFRAGETVVGQEARELQSAGEANVAAFFKRRMGDEHFVFHAQGRDYTAIDLSALLLGKLKADAEATLGERITDAVITVPAYFKNPEREATRAAGEKAGLKVVQLINEPTAAAIAYGAGQHAANGLTLVYDLGGGTFDVTLCRITGGEIRIVTSAGDHELGGKDWDDRIVKLVAAAFERELGVDPLADPVSVADLLPRVEDAKKKLSSLTTARVSLVHGGDHGRFEITREQFAEVTRDLLQRTIDLALQLLGEAGVGPETLDRILLVGGATRMPMVHEIIRSTFGKPAATGINVDEAVALGAALVAAGPQAGSGKVRIGGRRAAVDVTNHSLGMIAESGDRSAYVNSIILPKDRPVPCAQTRPYRFRTRPRGDNRVEIYMTQGEVTSPSDVTYIGKYVVSGLPHVDGGAAILDIGYAYDASGTVRVSGTLRNTSAPLDIMVEPLPDDLPQRFLGAPPAEPAPVHVTIYLAVDLSGSMAGAPLASAKQAAHEFMSRIDLAHGSVGIIAVADFVMTRLDASQNARAVARAIDSLQVGDVGNGNAGHPFDVAHDLMRGVAGRRYLIVLADGVWSNRQAAVERARHCHAAGIDVIAIGFGGADRGFLRSIASSEEGSIFTTMGALTEQFGSIAQVITEANGGLAAPAPSGRLHGR